MDCVERERLLDSDYGSVSEEDVPQIPANLIDKKNEDSEGGEKIWWSNKPPKDYYSSLIPIKIWKEKKTKSKIDFNDITISEMMTSFNSCEND